MSNKLSNEVLQELIKPMEGESEKAYQAFCEYAMLPETKRMQKIAFPIIAPRVHLSEATLVDYAKAFKWNERVSKITAYLLSIHIKQQADANLETLGEFLETNRAVKRETIENVKKGSSVIAKLMTRLESEVDSEGFKVKLTDIASLFTALEKGIKLVNEIPTEIINNRPISNRNVDEIENLDELDALEERLKAELEGRTIESDKIQ